MKTKKEILKWWEERGKITNGNDYKDFWEKISKNEVTIMETQEGEGEKQSHLLKILTKRSKYPLFLYFYDLECYKISGF